MADTPKTTKVTIANTSTGPRGVNMPDGTTLYLEPGQSVSDLEVHEHEADSLKASGHFEFGAKAKAAAEKAAEQGQ